MSNTIDKQINSQSFQIHEQEKAQRRNEEQVFTAKLKLNKLSAAKDIVLPSDPGDRDTKKSQKKGEKTSSKPTLPTPKKGGLNFNENDVSLIAIVGKVLAMQAKTNSLFWKNLWTTGFKLQTMQVHFAPIIGKAVKEAYHQQSLATKAQARMDEINAGIELGGFALATIGGGVMAGTASEETEAGSNAFGKNANEADDAGGAKNPAAAPTGPDTPEGESTATNASRSEAGRSEAAEDNANSGKSASEKNAKDAVNESKDSSGNAAKAKWEKTKSFFSRMGKFSQKWMVQASQLGQFINMGAGGSTSAVKAKYEGEVAAHQGKEGVYRAMSQEAEQYAQYYGQSFNRSEEIRQGAQQNINYAMDILKTVVQTITQTVNSMFQG